MNNTCFVALHMSYFMTNDLRYAMICHANYVSMINSMTMKYCYAKYVFMKMFMKEQMYELDLTFMI